MQASVSVITLGTTDLVRSRRFYSEGFGWTPVHTSDVIDFYQLNGVVLGLFLTPLLEEDMNRTGLVTPGAFALAHNVRTAAEVIPLMDRLAVAGGRITRPADAPPHGGLRGYVADPDDHAWEIAWNPAFAMDAEGNVTFGL
ncbi:VOC family protein [Devosia sp. ZB163]|uniref:VOC family protein n=1 Tax=Devosia sp. ZB163 TaxID=3025938 RepID=UPI00235F81A6|nr:VOC family protein [Devosia sp. ZB163]MDC9823657.1 VOC family protein [Devosia sp. ZB163]